MAVYVTTVVKQKIPFNQMTVSCIDARLGNAIRLDCVAYFHYDTPLDITRLDGVTLSVDIT